ncbi:MAG: SPOR domain-containing protein [Phenylobacterium sp.]|uniref:cell division protein FtsN n=1 Tax=Phenylobacterium sp. TaxID=1871053 RepID=UPI001A618921|nr:SPOR domain-containing protein [Phenylobacterium sp.]MBL8771860.1 SPOR domain-containing protein [Phenylobacterium sp.]
MSDHERGAYTPPTADAPLSFDPRQPVRGARPIPFTLILSVLVLAALVAAIFVFYQQGVRQAGEAPQVVGAPVGGMKEAAPATAQPQDPAAGLEIYRAEAAPMETVPEGPKFVPPPEQPQARPTTPVVVAQIPPAQPSPGATAAALKPAIPASAPPPAKTAPPPPAKAVTPPPKTVAAAPPPKPAPPPEKKAAPPEPKATASAGAARVQVGAVSSTALADKAWSDAVSAAPGLAAGKGKAVEKIEGGSLYRTFVTGFASRADAQAFCARLQGAGKSCFVR